MTVATDQRWRITWGTDVFREEDVTGEHLALIALLTGQDTWRHIDLTDLSPAVGPLRTMYLVVAFIAVADQVSEPDQLAALIQDVRSVPAEELLAAIRFEE